MVGSNGVRRGPPTVTAIGPVRQSSCGSHTHRRSARQTGWLPPTGETLAFQLIDPRRWSLPRRARGRPHRQGLAVAHRPPERPHTQSAQRLEAARLVADTEQCRWVFCLAQFGCDQRPRHTVRSRRLAEKGRTRRPVSASDVVAAHRRSERCTKGSNGVVPEQVTMPVHHRPPS
jgi:hypothetical protein